MQIRMHIIDESKAEFREMPQAWIHCRGCASKAKGDVDSPEAQGYCA